MTTADDIDERAEPDVTIVFGHDVRAPHQARAALARLFSDPDDPMAFAVELVASELVSNVVQHTTAGGHLRAWAPASGVPFRLEVGDARPDVPRAAVPETDVGGRGLLIVEAMSDSWGVETHAGGKVIWAEFRPSGSSAAPPSAIQQLNPALTVVTAAADGRPAGCLVAFHSQCSVEPVRYALWISKSNHTYRAALLSDHLAMHVLAVADTELAAAFGTPGGSDTDKFDAAAWTPGPSGVPLLTDCPNRIVLRKVAMWDDGSDHVCFVGEQVEVNGAPDLTPMRMSDAHDHALSGWH